MASLINNRGYSICRVCASPSLVSILNLGEQPLPSEYGVTSDENLQKFPLELRICTECGLGQLGEYVLPERIFHNKYPYLSSSSAYWIRHAKKYATEMTDLLSLKGGRLVVEIGSNDGYLLSQFKALEVDVLGVEPPENTANIARAAGIPTISEFFGETLARQIVEEYGHPALIVINNVYAHVPDLDDFTKGLAILADDKTVITIENPSFSILLNDGLFDTIYHEHYSYLSAHAVDTLAKKYDLSLYHVETLPTHGGSNRYYLSLSKNPDETVGRILMEEEKSGLFSKEKWDEFRDKAMAAIFDLREWLAERSESGDIVVGYGAAHKGNTFLNSVGREARVLKYVVDASPEKQGKFLPGSRLPVLSPSELNTGHPTDVLILPWNIADELSLRIKSLTPNARIWIAQPRMKQLN